MHPELSLDVTHVSCDRGRHHLPLHCTAQVEVQLLKLKNRATAYTCNGPSPLFFDPEGRGDLLVPTCYALWRCPNILEKLFTYSEVSPKVSMQLRSLDHPA